MNSWLLILIISFIQGFFVRNVNKLKSNYEEIFYEKQQFIDNITEKEKQLTELRDHPELDNDSHTLLSARSPARSGHGRQGGQGGAHRRRDPDWGVVSAEESVRWVLGF